MGWFSFWGTNAGFPWFIFLIPLFFCGVMFFFCRSRHFAGYPGCWQRRRTQDIAVELTELRKELEELKKKIE